jgi:CBS domain-containing protein
MKVKDVMTSDPKTCLIDAPASVAARIMWDYDCGVVPLVHPDGRLAGIVTDRDVCMAAYFEGQPLEHIAVSRAATTEPVAVRENDDVGTAEILMERYRVRRLPVVDAADHVVGIVSMSDLVRHMRDGAASDGERGVIRALYAVSWPGQLTFAPPS